jgi:hypothetical protein
VLPGFVTETGTVPGGLIRKARTETVMPVDDQRPTASSRIVPKFTQAPVPKLGPDSVKSKDPDPRHLNSLNSDLSPFLPTRELAW